jgi:hypothetical protein
MHSKADHSVTFKSRAGNGVAEQDKTGQDNTKRHNTQDRTRQDETTQHTGQDNTAHNTTHRTTQHTTKHTGQDRTVPLHLCCFANIGNSVCEKNCIAFS